MGEPGVGFRTLDWRVFQPARLFNRVSPDAVAGSRRARVRGSEQRDGPDQDWGHPDIPGRGWDAGKTSQLDTFCAVRIRRHCNGRGHRVLYLYRLRFGFYGGRGMPYSATRLAVRDHRLAGGLYR